MPPTEPPTTNATISANRTANGEIKQERQPKTPHSEQTIDAGEAYAKGLTIKEVVE